MKESDERAGSDRNELEENPGSVRCDACGAPMKSMGHCKYWCLRCGFLRTCNDVI
jgi:tRNA(Ile2) C34 agmatinyltransferase TiaS